MFQVSNLNGTTCDFIICNCDSGEQAKEGRCLVLIHACFKIKAHIKLAYMNVIEVKNTCSEWSALGSASVRNSMGD